MLLLIPLYALMALVASTFSHAHTSDSDFSQSNVVHVRQHHRYHRHFHRYPQPAYYQQTIYQRSYYPQPSFHRSNYGVMYYGGAHPVLVRQQHIVYTR